MAPRIGTLATPLLRDRFQLRSGLVDLVIGVRDDGGRGHLLALAGERFVSLIAERLAEVRDGGGQLWDRRQGYQVARKAGYCRGGLEPPQAIQECAEHREGADQIPEIPRVVPTPNNQPQMVERRYVNDCFRFEAGQSCRENRFVVPIAAVLSER